MIVKRSYYDFIENEEWLNEMSQDGYAMSDYRMGIFADTFSFEKCEPGEYIFRILVLDKSKNHPDSIRYLRFLRDSGVEHVGSNWYNAVFLRKKTADGPFEIFTDRNSQLKYHSKMARWYTASLLAHPVVMLAAAAMILAAVLLDVPSVWLYFGVGIAVGTSVGALLVLRVFIKTFQALRYHRRAVKRLKDEGMLYE